MAHQGVGGQEDLRGAVCLGDEGGQPTPTATWVRGDGPLGEGSCHQPED